ncbi:MAG: hypothetical protein AAB794_01260 [Patescibacteria group bacterium]
MKSPLIHSLVAIIVCVMVSIGYGMWYAAVGAKSVEVVNLEDKVVIKTETINRVASSRASLAEIADDEATIRSYFVPETGVVAFIDSLQSRGEAQGATVSVLSVSPAGATAATPSLVFALSIDGTFEAVMSTIGAIEYAPYDLTISSLSVTQGTENGWHANLNILVGSVSATQFATSTAPIVSPTARVSLSSTYGYF